MQNTDVVILAGGFGTRLQPVVNDVPKPMAPVCGKPFLYFIIRKLINNGFKRVILSVGYKSEVIENYFGNNFEGCELVYVNENEPLGTGGGILNTSKFWKNKTIIVLNGDTYFDIDINAALLFHRKKNADVSICLKNMDNTSRYGTVELNTDLRIVNFTEKKEIPLEGNINAGVYIFNSKVVLNKSFPKKFSIEKDFFEKEISNLKMYGIVSNDYFIDIGIPEDYNKANEDFKKFEY